MAFHRPSLPPATRIAQLRLALKFLMRLGAASASATRRCSWPHGCSAGPSSISPRGPSST